MKKLIPFSLAAVALLFGACNSVESRIKEKSEVYNSLDPATQSKIKQGDIDVGFTPDMVYIALGQPDAKRQRTTSDGNNEVWIYNTYYDRYEGSARVGYRRWFSFNPTTNRYTVFWEPVYSDVYSQHKEEVIRVTFRNGQVATIDQSKDRNA